jgi:predicted HAD superfamily hydrolase
MVENGKIFVIFLTFSSRNHRDHTFLLMIRNLEFRIPPARRELGLLKWFDHN